MRKSCTKTLSAVTAEFLLLTFTATAARMRSSWTSMRARVLRAASRRHRWACTTSVQGARRVLSDTFFSGTVLMYFIMYFIDHCIFDHQHPTNHPREKSSSDKSLEEGPICLPCPSPNVTRHSSRILTSRRVNQCMVVTQTNLPPTSHASHIHHPGASNSPPVSSGR